jgi:TolB-like protein/Flp pilus assembly protein TadD
MPFENLGPSTLEYFAVGLGDEVTSRLAGLEAVTVIGRQTTEGFTSSRLPPIQVAAALHADFLLSASVSWEERPDGRWVRIRPVLLRTSDSSQVWGDPYEANAREGFKVQSEVAQRVADALGVTISGASRQAIARVPTRDSAAYGFFLQGEHYHLASNGERDALLAVENYTQAVARDPEFAEAWAGLSGAHAWMYWQAWDRSPTRLAAAQSALARLLALDSVSLTAKLAIVGYRYFSLDLDGAWAVVEPLHSAYPQNAAVHLSEAGILRRRGQMKEALRAFQEASDLDPAYWRYAVDAGETYATLHDGVSARREFERAMRLKADEASIYGYLAQSCWSTSDGLPAARQALQRAERLGLSADPHVAYTRVMTEYFARDAAGVRRELTAVRAKAFEHQFWYIPVGIVAGDALRAFGGDSAGAKPPYRAAVDQLRERIRRYPDDPRYHRALALALAGLGEATEARAEAARAVAMLPPEREAMRGFYALEDQARVLAMIGDHDAAVAILERLVNMPSSTTPALLRLDPRLDPLRRHPRFIALMKQPLRPL